MIFMNPEIHSKIVREKKILKIRSSRFKNPVSLDSLVDDWQHFPNQPEYSIGLDIIFASFFHL